ncbi:Uncharacterised protein [Mycobacteroides abscessus subsp. abscessus]|nr:Uncharacterised protein [Mycobacteroides abscessus subsp. abscessus]SIC03950.1 Uncharacterised protein [Mycobacteroides abscessus subsp. abscessus]
MVFDTPLPVEAEILPSLAMPQIGDVLAGDGVQPAQPFWTGQGEHGPGRPVDEDGVRERRTLLTQRVAIVPHRPGVGVAFGYVHSRHRSLYFFAQAAHHSFNSTTANLIAHGGSGGGHTRR